MFMSSSLGLTFVPGIADRSDGNDVRTDSANFF